MTDLTPGKRVNLARVPASPWNGREVDWGRTDSLFGEFTITDYVTDNLGTTMFVTHPLSGREWAIDMDRYGHLIVPDEERW
jgi:hypothetical protein